MRRLKMLVTTVVFLVSFVCVSSAEMTVTSLQERMRQSDAVVVGTIEEIHQSDTGAGGQLPAPVKHWRVTCRVERYIIGPKIHNPNVEEAKAVSLIYIVFEQKLQKPAPVELVAGKKYLLFLKETGPNEYEMITPYHGAFEAGQDYFVYDEKSPEYPSAVKMSFEEIVQRVSPSSGTFIDIRDQSRRRLSEDELRMKDRLIALNRGEGAVADLRVELMDGGAMTIGKSGIYEIADGKITSQQWDGIASPVKRQERSVTDEEIRQLLRTLIEHQYWTFQGAKFVPDAPGLMFRFHYQNMAPVEYRCDAHEYEPSAQLSAIRSVWLNFVSGTSSRNPAHLPTEDQVKATQPLTLTIQTVKEVYEQGEPINIEASIKNSGKGTAKIYSPAYWGVSEITVTNPRCAGAKIMSTDLTGVLTSNTITIEIDEKGG